MAAKKNSVVKGKAAAKTAKPVKSALARNAAKKKIASAKPASKKTARTKKPAVPEITLGRPLVTQEEKLYLLFKDDYHARQIFEFLRVETVKELEQFSPSQIVRILSKPISTTVERIRQRLAEMKRSLRDDAEFAAEFREQHPAK